jgi:hypothetical protein
MNGWFFGPPFALADSWKITLLLASMNREVDPARADPAISPNPQPGVEQSRRRSRSGTLSAW